MNIRKLFAAGSAGWYGLFYLFYVLAAFTGRLLTSGEFHFTPIWFAGAVYIVFLLCVPYSHWWKVVCVAALAHLSYAFVGPGEYQLRMFFFLGRTLEALTGAYLFRRFVNTRNTVNTLQQSIRLVLFTCLGSTVLSALVGTVALSLFTTEKLAGLSFPVWWSGNVLGQLVILPLFFLDWKEGLKQFQFNFRKAEALFILVVSVGLGLFSFVYPAFRSAVGNLVVFPLLFYLSYRFRTLGLSLMTLVLLAASAYGKIVWPEFFLYSASNVGVNFASALSHLALYYITLYLFIAMVREREFTIQELRTSEEKFRLLAENSKDIIYKVRIDPVITFDYIGRAITLLTGYNVHEIRKKPIETFARLFQKERSLFAEIIHNIQSLNGTFICRWVTKNGAVIWIEHRGWAVVDETGKTVVIEGSIRDITEAKENELLAVKNQSRLQKAEAVASMGSWELVLATGTVYWTDQLRRLCGFEDSVTPSVKALMERVPFSHRAYAVHAYESIKIDGRPYSIEHPLLQKNGELLWVASRAEVVLNQEGKPESIVGSFLDITGQIVREQENNRQNELLTTIFNNSPYAVLLINKNREIVKVNKSTGLKQAGGYTALGQLSPGDILQCRHAIPGQKCGDADACVSCPIHIHINEAFEHGIVVYNAEVELETRQNRHSEMRNMLVSTAVLKEEERLLLLTIADISRQREAEDLLRASEERVRFIADNIADVIWTAAPDFTYTYISRADERQRGYSEADLLGKSIFDQIVPEYRSLVRERYQEAAASAAMSKVQPFVLEYEQICKHGAIIWTEVVCTPVVSDDGQILRFQGVSREVSERHRVLQETLMQAELHQQMFRKHSAIQLLLDSFTGNIVDANESAVEYYGYSLEKFKTISVGHLSTLSAEDLKQRLYETSQAGRNYFTSTHRLANGELREVEVYSAGLIVGGQHLLYSIVHDITERISTAKKLESSEKKFKEIFDQSVDIIYRIDLQGRFLSISPSATVILGYHQVELIGRNIKEILTPASHEASLKELAKKTRDEQPETVSKYEVEIITKDGGVKYFEINSRLTTDETDVVTILGIARDISDRKRYNAILHENEIRFKSIWNQSVDGMRIIDNAGDMLMVNDAFCILTGKTQQQLIGKPFSIIYKDGDDENMVLTGQGPMYVHFRERVAEEAIEKIMERKVELWNGRIMWLEISNSIIKWEGTEKHILSIFRDITERKRTSVELERTNEELQTHIETKNKFIAILSHDLRGPYHGFLGLTKHLSENVESMSSEDIMEIATKLHQALTNQFNLLNEILEWSKLQTGSMKFEPESVSIKEEVKAVYNQFLPLIALKKLMVSLHINDSFQLFCDVHMVRLLIRNLLSNAIKFSHPAGRIQIKAEESSQFDSLIFEDSGVGMPEDVKAKLFSLQQVVSRQGTAGEKGSGIGLVFCKEIMERHGGAIEISSEKEKGTCIALRFPKKTFHVTNQ